MTQNMAKEYQSKFSMGICAKDSLFGKVRAGCSLDGCDLV